MVRSEDRVDGDRRRGRRSQCHLGAPGDIRTNSDTTAVVLSGMLRATFHQHFISGAFSSLCHEVVHCRHLKEMTSHTHSHVCLQTQVKHCLLMTIEIVTSLEAFVPLAITACYRVLSAWFTLGEGAEGL